MTTSPPSPPLPPGAPSQDSAESGDTALITRVSWIRACTVLCWEPYCFVLKCMHIIRSYSTTCKLLKYVLNVPIVHHWIKLCYRCYISWSPLSLDWLVCGTGSVETAAPQPVHHVDGRQHHLSIPHHDGGHDVCEASAGSHGHQGWWVVSYLSPTILHSLSPHSTSLFPPLSPFFPTIFRIRMVMI